MRVFLKNAKTIQKDNGGSISWPAEAFCEVSDSLGKEWIDAGEALPATIKNEIMPTADADVVSAFRASDDVEEYDNGED